MVYGSTSSWCLDPWDTLAFPAGLRRYDSPTILSYLHLPDFLLFALSSSSDFDFIYPLCSAVANFAKIPALFTLLCLSNIDGWMPRRTVTT